MQKITPCLWFDDQAEEAMTSTFPSSRTPRQMGKIDISRLQQAYDGR
jgi:predicted 3-demethylubiquinone-9 3-methyltransferase (glyoxalase superfamily)